MSQAQDLSVQAFLELRKLFFAADGQPYILSLRDKGTTQDDPLDEYIAQSLKGIEPGIGCIKAPSLTTPDLVLMRPVLKRIMVIERKGMAKTVHRFYAYRLTSDVSLKTAELTVQDPFTKVRKEGQGQRGRLALDISIVTSSSNETSEDIDIESGESL